MQYKNIFPTRQLNFHLGFRKRSLGFGKFSFTGLSFHSRVWVFHSRVWVFYSRVWVFYSRVDKIFCTLAWTSLQCRLCLCPHKGDTESKALAWSLNWNPIHASSPSSKCSEYSSVYVNCLVLIMLLNRSLFNSLLVKRLLQCLNVNYVLKLYVIWLLILP